MILEEIEELINSKNELNIHQRFEHLLSLTGSVIGSIAGLLIAPTSPYFGTILGGMVGRYIGSIISSLRANQIFNKLVFSNHQTFLNNYFNHLQECEKKSKVKELDRLEAQFNQCMTATQLFMDTDKQFYELRKCYLKYLDQKSKILKENIDPKEYQKFRTIFKELLPVEENLSAPIIGTYPPILDFNPNLYIRRKICSRNI